MNDTNSVILTYTALLDIPEKMNIHTHCTTTPIVAHIGKKYLDGPCVPPPPGITTVLGTLYSKYT